MPIFTPTDRMDMKNLVAEDKRDTPEYHDLQRHLDGCNKEKVDQVNKAPEGALKLFERMRRPKR